MSVTICITDTLQHVDAARAVMTTLHTLHACCHVHGVLWISDQPWPGAMLSVPVHHVRINRIQRFPLDYNAIMLCLLPRLVTTNHCLVVQADGYAVNAHAWCDEFLAYDYVGAVMDARWVPHRAHAVGNGGFSLRSRKLLTALQHMQLAPSYHNEDTEICCSQRDRLENEFGIKFAPHNLADRFSIEYNTHSVWHGRSLGFHGRHIQHLYPHPEVS